MTLVIVRSNPKIARYILLKHLNSLPKGSAFEASELAVELQIPGYLVKKLLFEFKEMGKISHLIQKG